jgi:hypothetical protein
MQEIEEQQNTIKSISDKLTAKGEELYKELSTN